MDFITHVHLTALVIRINAYFRLTSGLGCLHIPECAHIKGEPNLEPTFFHFESYLLVVVSRPVRVEELVSVEDALSARFTRYGMKINILASLWFLV